MKLIIATILIGLALCVPAAAQVKFVSLDHGIYTFERGDTVIRAKCYGTLIESTFVDGCSLGNYKPGQFIPEFDVDKFVGGKYHGDYISVDSGGVYYDDGIHRCVMFNIISWKQKPKTK